MGIKSIIPSQVLDSRGEPTVRVEMTSENDVSASFVVPGGASIGAEEAIKKTDGTESYGGRSVNNNVDIINQIIAPKFIGYPLGHQDDFDSLLIALDGTNNKQNLGANTILAMSGAYFKISAKLSNKPLWQYIAEDQGSNPQFPRIFANVIGGGKHAPGLDIQEFMVVPQGNNPIESIEQIVQIYNTLKTIMISLYGPTAKLSGDEGAIAPVGARTEVVLEALYNLNQKAQNKFDIALDVAANSFYDGKAYQFEGQSVHANDLITTYQDWNNKFGLFSIEDPVAETDLEGIELLKTMPKDKKSFMVIGDDFTVTNPVKIKEFAENKIIDGVIIKPDQVGSISEMLNAVSVAKQSGLKIIVSHRSGESNDDFIVDLAYGLGAEGIKVGAPSRGERVAKYNRLLEIQYNLDALQSQAAAQVPAPMKPTETPHDIPKSSPASTAANTLPPKMQPEPKNSNDVMPQSAHQSNQMASLKDISFGREESIPKAQDVHQRNPVPNEPQSEEPKIHDESSPSLESATPTPKEPMITGIKVHPAGEDEDVANTPQTDQSQTSSFTDAIHSINPAARSRDENPDTNNSSAVA
jgi:enolase